MRSKQFLFEVATAFSDSGYKDISEMPEIKVDIIDLQAEDKDFDLGARLKQINPDIVGVSAVTALYNQAAEIARVASRTVPDALRFIGGAHISGLAQDGNEHIKRAMLYSYFQIAVLREAEEKLAEIVFKMLKGESIANVPDVVYKGPMDNFFVGRNLSSDNNSLRMLSLNRYPYPALSLDLIDVTKYESLVNPEGENRGVPGVLMTSRGCPFECKHCASKSIFRKGIEYRSAENIFEEITFYYNRGFRAFYIFDDNFALKKKRLSRLADLIQKSGYDIEYSIMTHANSVNAKVASDLKRARCKVVCIGAETGDDRILRDINKNTSVKTIKRATKLLQEQGIHVKHYYMVGIPGQDWASIKKTAELIMEARPDSINVAVATPYPGSDFQRERMIKMNASSYDDFLHEPEPPMKGRALTRVVTYTDEMTSRDIDDARRLLMSLFDNIDNKAQVKTIMEKIDSRIEKDEAEVREAKEVVLNPCVLEVLEYLDELSAILKEGLVDRSIADDEQILLSENLFIGKDGDSAVLDQMLIALAPVIQSGHVAILNPKKMRRMAINRNINREKVAAVFTREDFDDKAIWNGTDKLTSLKSSVLIIDDRLVGNNYLYLEGVIGLARAIMAKDKSAIRRYYNIMSEKRLDDKVLDLLDGDDQNNVTFAIWALLKFKPITSVNDDKVFDKLRIMMENALIAA